MGVVYKAFDSAFGREVAVKVLPDQVDHDELLYRFRREGTDLAGLNHPNVVACYEFGAHNGHDYIVMEYVSGGNLRNFARSSDSLADIVAAYVAICNGLEHIHSQGIVHRDVKPGNILFTPDGIPKITDFGISRHMDSETQLTQVGTIMGTSSFVAPEMILSSSTVTPSADLYALGVCLFESLTGKLPITGETEYAVLNAHLNEKPAKPSELRPDVPPMLDDIVLQLLAKKPEERPSSAKEAARLLKECLQNSLNLKPPEFLAEDDEPTEPTATGQYLEGLITIDTQGKIESCNPDAAALLGRASTELFGQPVDRFLPKMRVLAKKGQKFTGETFVMEGRRRVDQPIPLEVTLTATQSARGPQLNAVIKASEQDSPETAASELLRAGQFDFLNRMSHEVWTPMNGILGMTRLTLNTDLSTEQRKYLKDLETSAERLREVLGTAMDFSRLGDGTLHLEPVPIDVRQFVESVLKPYIFQAKAKNLQISIQVAPLVPDTIVADPARLKQVLGHLLDNALKFTDKGHIGVTVDRQSGDDHVVTLKFAVSDTGQGLLPGREKLVFRPFYQEDSSISRKSGGVGLGLSIVKGLVSKMNGRVWVDSQRGRGSVFQFVADFGVAERPHETSYRNRMGSLKVLLLDPGRQYQAVANLLKRWGLEVSVGHEVGESGKAIEQARTDGEPFDLILAEAHGVYFDAFKFVRNYKLSNEAFVLFTREIQDGDAQKCRLLGVDSLLEKPINATELWECVHKVLNNGPRSRSASFGSLRILLAEDNPVNQTLATVLLKSRGHEVTVAGDGLQVLKQLEEKEFDFILMDLQMPQMDGITTTKKIRTDEEGTDRRIPIVALTAHTQAGSLEKCMEAGMDGFLNKPIEEDELMDVIARVVDRSTRMDIAEEAPPSRSDNEPTYVPAPKQAEAAPPVVSDTETTNYNVIDEKMFLNRIGHNSQNLCTLVDIFLTLYGEQLQNIKKAIDAGDPEALRQSAHKFKGSVANFSAKAAAEQAEALEELGRAGTTMGAESEYVALVRETEILIIALKSLKERHTGKG